MAAPATGLSREQQCGFGQEVCSGSSDRIVCTCVAAQSKLLDGRSILIVSKRWTHCSPYDTCEQCFLQVSIWKTCNCGELPGSFIAKYAPCSVISTDIASIDKGFDFVGGTVGLVGIRDRGSCIVGAFDQVFVKVHKDVDCKGEIDVYVTVDEFCKQRHL